MERVLDVYRRPYNPAMPVVCMDETPRQLIRETRLPIADPAHVTTTSISAAVSAMSSWRQSLWPGNG